MGKFDILGRAPVFGDCQQIKWIKEQIAANESRGSLVDEPVSCWCDVEVSITWRCPKCGQRNSYGTDETYIYEQIVACENRRCGLTFMIQMDDCGEASVWVNSDNTNE